MNNLRVRTEEEKKVIMNNRAYQYAAKFVADNYRNTPATNEIMKCTFSYCIIPAKKIWYDAIREKIEEFRKDHQHRFRGEN